MKVDKEATEMKSQSLFDLNANADKKAQCLEHVMCKEGKKCIYVCCSENCESHAAICADIFCDCQKYHNQTRPCPAHQLPVIFKMLQSKRQNFPDLLKWINTKYDELIDWISKKREEIYLRTKSAGLNEAQMNFLTTVYAGKCEELTGKTVHEVVKNLYSEKREIEIAQALLINRISQEWKHCSENIQKKVSAINLLINNALKSDFSLEGLNSKVAATGTQRATVTEMLNDGKKVLRYELLYRASENNFNTKKFWEKCHQKADTVTLIHTEFDKVIGGYTPLSWKKKHGSFEEDPSLRSFVFSVTEKTRFKLKESNKRSAIKHEISCGPIFGGGCDIIVYDKANGNNSYANIGCSYENSKVQYSTKEAWQFFQGSTEKYSFRIKEWEVWQVVFE